MSEGGSGRADLSAGKAESVGEAESFPEIPPGRYFPIGEAARLARSNQNALRYWEEKIPSLAALVVRRNGRRYYTPEAILLLRRLRSLRRDEGRTVAGASAALERTASRARRPSAEWRRVERELREIAALLD